MYTYGLLLCLLVSCIQNGSGSGRAPQTCDKTRSSYFYCPYVSGDPCTEFRWERCTGRDTCYNHRPTDQDDLCYETSQGYTVYLGHATLSSSGSSGSQWWKWWKWRNPFVDPEHQFITFRGFTYEYGSSYGAQVLDISDPIYKYKDGREIISSPTDLGDSICTWEDANMVVIRWLRQDYRLNNNCQHFAEDLSRMLLTGSCNNRASGKRQADNSTMTMEEYIDQQLRNCSLACCGDEETNHGYPLATNGLLILLMAVGIVVLAL